MLPTPFKDSPHGVVLLPFLQEEERFEGQIKGASVLTSGEFCTGLPGFQYKEPHIMLGTFIGG